ncbi:acid sphingomyelinase [Stereum hirsutum FP-91666 SS1]|uniref:acid sphingomyelinase n=1 Tax=Stereum hirsutum (strain FP-91666) TaxID=721885 RepID=UPI000440A47B|nr:acid sphingomyelinase [Stereum hirsutum FP-91666 SS1]EIM91610.1 acid sphingomyelinase [Stereum hirsutum FP-91666 SS1]
MGPSSSKFFSLLLLSIVIVLDTCRADLFTDIITGFEGATDCSSCQSVLLPPLQTLANQGDANFTVTMTEVCEALQLADVEVCSGTFSRTGLILSHGLRGFSPNGTTAVKFCNAVFGLCQQPPVTPFHVSFPKPAPSGTKFISRGRPPFQVLHISDVHIDRFYTVGADGNCSESICCRDPVSNMSVPVAVSDPAGPFGNTNCDSPVSLSRSLLGAMNVIGIDAKFSIFTGDVVERATWSVDRSEVMSDLVDWNEEMTKLLDMPIYPALGNHDSAPVNSFPRKISATNPNITSAQFVFDTQSAGWEGLIGQVAANQVEHDSGSYSVVHPGTNLRIISMNTQYWYIQNYWLYDTDEQIPDPNGLFAFLVYQLQEAEEEGQRAWIIGHIPSGKADFPHDQSNYYDQIIQRYKNTISAQFAGHSHVDEFQIAYSDYNNQTAKTADSVIFVGPALTPQSGNPAFKLYDIDPDTYEVLDAKVFMANITDPTFQTSGPTWELYYSARDSYGPLVSAFTNTTLSPADPLNASFWHVLTEVFASNGTAFQEWNTRKSRGGSVGSCTGSCVTNSVCDMRAARSENNCVSSHFLCVF